MDQHDQSDQPDQPYETPEVEDVELAAGVTETAPGMPITVPTGVA